ncbi:MAG: CPBP family intramembrane metalloprotease [Lachnospiraceae bacterium]|nr:CPBP family intramembrane metalloprotease [Lachnospiraceae bacterium]
MSNKKELLIYILSCLIITNILWYVGYGIHEKNEGSVIELLVILLASFMPAIIAVIMCKLKKAKFRTLLLFPNIKKSLKVYLTAIFTSLLIVYSADLLPLLFFPGNVLIVSENLTFIFFGQIILFTLVCIIESIGLLGEELGWMGYLFPGLEKEYGTFLSIFIISIVRTLWHLVALIKIDGSLFAVCNLFISNLFLQSLLVYVTKKSNSVFPAAIVHSITNIMIALSFVTYTEEFYNNNSVRFNLIELIPVIIVGTVFFILLYKDKNEV